GEPAIDGGSRTRSVLRATVRRTEWLDRSLSGPEGRLGRAQRTPLGCVADDGAEEARCGAQGGRALSAHVVRLGSPRKPGEGLRLGTVRRPPRGVRKEDYAKRDYYDVWVPELAPSGDLVSWALSEPFTD